jgi:hypothetical protein
MFIQYWYLPDQKVYLDLHFCSQGSGSGRQRSDPAKKGKDLPDPELCLRWPTGNNVISFQRIQNKVLAPLIFWSQNCKWPWTQIRKNNTKISISWTDLTFLKIGLNSIPARVNLGIFKRHYSAYLQKKYRWCRYRYHNWFLKHYKDRTLKNIKYSFHKTYCYFTKEKNALVSRFIRYETKYR